MRENNLTNFASISEVFKTNKKQLENMATSTSGLYQAVLECRYQQVKFFLDSGLRLSKRLGNADNLLLAALHIDDDLKRRKMFNFLLRRGANYLDPDSQTGRTTLVWAAYMNRTAQVISLLRYDAGEMDISQADYNGYTSLHYAVTKGNVTMVRVLIKAYNKYGLNVDVQDRDGMTPLIHAKKLGSEEIAELLETEGKASINQADGKLFRSIDEWKRVGKLRRDDESRRLAKIYGSSTLRVLPELDPRGLYRTKTTLLSRSTSKYLPITRKSYTLPAVYKKRSVENLRSILKYKNEKTVIFPDGNNYPEEVLNRQKSKSVQIVEEDNSIRQMMNILSDQICDSYRDPVLQNTDALKTNTIQEALAEQRKGKKPSTLASILAKVKHKSDEMERRHRLKHSLDKHTKKVKKRHTEAVQVEKSENPEKPRKVVRIQLPHM